MLLSVGSSFIPNMAYALDCVAIVDGKEITTETARVDDIVIPEFAANNEKIWESDIYVRQVECSKGVDENVYFYPFPNLKTSDLPSGMKFGLVYNGTEYDLKEGMKIKTDIIVKPNQSATGTINVQVFIKKSGEITKGYNGNLPIYQLDGEGGLNNNSGAKNFRFHLSNLNNVATSNCTYVIKSKNEKNNVAISDNLISPGITLSAIGDISASCTRGELLNNRYAVFDMYTTNSGGGSGFDTDKDGLSYDLTMDNKILNPSNVKNKPVSVKVKLDASGKGTLDIGQRVHLESAEKSWLYTNATVAISNKANLSAGLTRFE